MKLWASRSSSLLTTISIQASQLTSTSLIFRKGSLLFTSSRYYRSYVHAGPNFSIYGRLNKLQWSVYHKTHSSRSRMWKEHETFNILHHAARTIPNILSWNSKVAFCFFGHFPARHGLTLILLIFSICLDCLGVFCALDGRSYGGSEPTATIF